MEFVLLLKSACECVVSQATSSAGKEIALQEGVVNDAKFLSEELEEMHKFLVNVERDEAAAVAEAGSSSSHDDVNEARGWVDKIRDMACDIEDCLRELGPHGVEGLSSLRNLRWATLASRHSVAAELKDLVSQVSRLSERKERYRRAGGRTARRPAAAVWKEEARLVVPDIDWRVDLGQLLARPDESLVVVAVWLMKDPVATAGAASLIGETFDDADRFQCRAWVTATHPVSVTEFLRALVRQLLANDSVPAPASLGDTETMGTEELMKVAAHHLDEKRYLVVVEDVCARPVWDWIKLFFPDHRNGSRIIVTSRRADVARHCASRPTRLFMLERVVDDDARVYVSSSSDRGATKGLGVVIQIEPYSEFIGRKEDVAELTRLILENVTGSWPISVYGASGIGKSTLVRKVVYESPDLTSEIQRRAWVTMLHPFNPEDFLRSIISQFRACSSPGKSKKSEINIRNMSHDELVTEVSQLMEDGERSVVIVDGLSAQEEWDQVKSCLCNDGDVGSTCTVIVTTTNAASAQHCSGNSNNVYTLSPLDSAADRQLFYQKRMKETKRSKTCSSIRPMSSYFPSLSQLANSNQSPATAAEEIDTTQVPVLLP
uniref:Uncharacterized protein n=1 Tax=Avena sativa TaxID=4498 RepID=A0ACD5VBC4_AVESA